MPSAQQWRQAAFDLRKHAAKWEAMAEEQEDMERGLLAPLLKWWDVHEHGSLLDRTKAHDALFAAVDAWRRNAPDSRCPLWEEKR